MSLKQPRSDAPLSVGMLLYVLECEPANGHHPTYYIGVSYSLNNRLAQHTSNRGSQWTRLHKPVRVAECRMNATLHQPSPRPPHKFDRIMRMRIMIT